MLAVTAAFHFNFNGSIANCYDYLERLSRVFK